MRARLYELVHVAGGYQLHTKARYADAIRVLSNGGCHAGPPALTPTELLAVTAIAYLKPATRAELSQLAGRETSRYLIGRLKALGLIARDPRAPTAGAPYAYVTTNNSWKCLDWEVCATCPMVAKIRRPRRTIFGAAALTKSNSNSTTAPGAESHGAPQLGERGARRTHF
ncbi:SMC-Scp complex subunit ScpB [Methylocystis sp. H62]|uniref:SMC-Scp complex subunit ScpB n=1 Tax=Methylocystis sp. H62 TaxID=2785789 RepID=UPI001FEF399A|nr:SMC-Scp complex subunit ScpB [Methylocystis sp. H62]